MALRRSGTTFTARSVRLEWLTPGSTTRFQLTYVAPKDLSAVRFAASMAWIDMSTNGGSSWTALPTSASSGIDIGAQSAGDSTLLDFRINVPASEIRRTKVEILIGEEE